MTVTYYLVGGHVRDELLGRRSKDVDFAVEAGSYEEMLADVLARGAYVWQERPEFGSIRANDPVYGPADFTLCRRDGVYSDGRRPDSIESATILEDLSRRDFTVNAIAKTPLEGEYLDPHGGRRDLEAMVLRCVGDPRLRFMEDYLRLLRAVRFHLVRDFRLSLDIQACLRDPVVLGGLTSVSVERVYDELGKCYRHDTYATLRFFRNHRLLEDAVFSDGRLRLTPGTGGRP